MRFIAVLCVAALLMGCNSTPHHAEGRSYYTGQPLDIPGPVFSGDSRRMISVQVVGEVVRPQSYRLAAGSTISDVLRRAGGFTELGHQRAILLCRGGKTLVIDFRRVRRDMRYDLILEDGDEIFVPRETGVGIKTVAEHA